jgi:hypothetical protein
VRSYGHFEQKVFGSRIRTHHHDPNLNLARLNYRLFFLLPEALLQSPLLDKPWFARRKNTIYLDNVGQEEDKELNWLELCAIVVAAAQQIQHID